MIKHMNIESCDKYDRQEKNKKFYISFTTTTTIGGYYTDNIWEEIYKHQPDTITLETLNFAESDKINAVGIFASYVNSLIAEGWELVSDYTEDNGEKWVDGMSLKFKISKENKKKMIERVCLNHRV